MADDPRGPTANGHDRPAGRGVPGDDLLAAWRRMRGRLPELERHVLAYASVHVDRARLSLRRLLLRLVASVLVAAAMLAATITAAAMLAAGIGEGMTALLGGSAWLGHCLGGLLALGAVATTIALAYERKRRRDWGRLLRRYGPPPPPEAARPHHVDLEAQGPEL